MAERSKVAGLLALNGIILATHMILARRAHGAGVDPIVYALAGAAGAERSPAGIRLIEGVPSRLATWMSRGRS